MTTALSNRSVLWEPPRGEGNGSVHGFFLGSALQHDHRLEAYKRPHQIGLVLQDLAHIAVGSWSLLDQRPCPMPVVDHPAHRPLQPVSADPLARLASRHDAAGAVRRRLERSRLADALAPPKPPPPPTPPPP